MTIQAPLRSCVGAEIEHRGRSRHRRDLNQVFTKHNVCRVVGSQLEWFGEPIPVAQAVKRSPVEGAPGQQAGEFAGVAVRPTYLHTGEDPKVRIVCAARLGGPRSACLELTAAAGPGVTMSRDRSTPWVQLFIADRPQPESTAPAWAPSLGPARRTRSIPAPT